MRGVQNLYWTRPPRDPYVKIEFRPKNFFQGRRGAQARSRACTVMCAQLTSTRIQTMSSTVSAVRSQYAHGSLLRAINSALAETGTSEPTVEDLAPVDEFHIRGRDATRALLDRVDLPEAPIVLDVGCGIGGTARLLAGEYGAHVLGVDLCEEYCQVARELTRRVHLEDRVTIRQGDALDLPTEGVRFDLVVSEHVQMNVENKSAYLEEMSRVLKPGGVLALYEIFAGRDGDRHFPVPWADDSSVSFLVSGDVFRQVMTGVGLDVLWWDNCTEEGRTWFERTLERAEEHGPPPVGLHLLMGESTKEKMTNVVRNLREDRIEIISAVARK